MLITESLFLAWCKCPYKAYLKSKGEVGKVRDYEAIQTEADALFKKSAIERLLASHAGEIILQDPPPLTAAIDQDAALILGATVSALDWEHRIEAIEQLRARDSDGKAVHVPLTFSHRNKLSAQDSLLAAFQGMILAEALVS